MQSFFFNGWMIALRTIVVGILGYIAIVLLLRISGKRTLSKMNAFDLIVTVALGSTFARLLLAKDDALVEAIIAFSLLILLQYTIAWLSLRSTTVLHLVKSEPTLIFHKGEFLEQAMRAQRVTEPEVYAAIRSGGVARLDQVEAVVLETDGSFSVVKRPEQGAADTLGHVENAAGSGNDERPR